MSTSLEVRNPAGLGEARAPSPEKILETLTAYQHTAALKTAIELNLFTAVGRGTNTASSLAATLHAPERGVRILCDCLVVMGFLIKHQNCYGLTADSAFFLDEDSRGYLGSAANFLASPVMMDTFKDLARVVRLGRPLTDHAFSTVEHPIWVEFARSMAPLMYLPAEEVAKLLSHPSPTNLLDIAAGHGMYGISIALNHREAKVTVLDFPSVLKVAAENAERAGVSNRYRLLPGNAFELDWGGGFDAVLIPNLLHSFDRSANELLLKKTYDALAAQGRVVVVEFAPHEDRVSPRIPALFALPMLANSGGDAYTVSEHQSMLHAAGFFDCKVHRLAATSFTAIVAMRP